MYPLVHFCTLLTVWLCSPSSCMTHGWVVSHAGSSREPKMNTSQEQTKLPGWGLGLFSSCLQSPRDGTLKWSRKSGHWLLSWSCQGDGFWDRSSPFSQVVQHLTKSSFLVHQHLPHVFGFCGDWQPNPCFCFVTPSIHFVPLSQSLFLAA